MCERIPICTSADLYLLLLPRTSIHQNLKLKIKYTLQPTQAHDQSLAALNDIPALSFMRSPDRAPAPAPTVATGQNVQRSLLAGPKTSWIPVPIF